MKKQNIPPKSVTGENSTGDEVKQDVNSNQTTLFKDSSVRHSRSRNERNPWIGEDLGWGLYSA